MTAIETTVTADYVLIVSQSGSWRTVTPLLNRGQIVDQIGRELQRTRKCLGSRYVLLSLELDCYRATVASQGRKAGDDLVTAVAERIGSLLSAHDAVASLGRGTMAILLESVGVPGSTLSTVDVIQRELMAGLKVGEQTIYTTASIGITKVATPYATAEDVLWDAGIAMRRAKAEGKARAATFHLMMDHERLSETELEQELRVALERDEFVLHFQPIISPRTGKVDAFEALLRWNHPSKGLQAPAEFLQTLKDSGLIVPVGEWVVKEACANASRWREIAGRTIPVTINLASEELSALSVITAVNDAIDHGTDAASVTLEISEDALFDALAASGSLSLVRDRGVRIVVDDFGSGYSSLDFVGRLPIDAIKMDASFADRIAHYAADRPVMRNIVDLAHALGLDVYAEGLDRPGQLDDAVRLGCEGMQGLLISGPVEAKFAERMLEAEWTAMLDGVPEGAALTPAK